MGTIRFKAASTSLSRNRTRPPILWAQILPRFTQSVSVTSEMRKRQAVSCRVRYFVSVFGCTGRSRCSSSRRDSRIISESWSAVMPFR